MTTRPETFSRTIRVPRKSTHRKVLFGSFVFLLFIFSFTFSVQTTLAAHTFDASTTQTRTRNTSGVTFNHTCGAGTTLLTLTIVNGGTTPRTGGAPTYNGVAMTQSDQNGQAPSGAETVVELWYLLDPSTGSSYQINIPDSNNIYVTANASSYKAASGYKTVLKTDDDDGGTSINPTGPSLTGLVSGDVIVAVVGSGATTWAPSAQTGTQLYDVDNGSYGNGAQYLIKTDSSDTAMGWTFGTSDDWSVVEAAFTEISPIDQEGFRFRNDDGSESAATWLANQDLDASRDINTPVRLRTVLNTPADPISIPFRLEYKKSTDSVYKKVLASESGSSTHSFVNSKRWKGNGAPSARNFDTGIDATLLVVTIVGAGATQRAGGAPTYNGVAMTQADQTRGGALNYETSAELWYMIDPPSGSNAISIPNTGAITLYATASSYSAGDGYTSAFDASGFSEATTGANPSASVSASVAGDVYVAVLGDGLATAPTARTGTALAEVDDGSYSDNHQYYIKAGTGSQTISWTVASDDHAMIVAAFKVVAVSQPILLTDSTYISAGGGTNTTAQLTAPSGKTTSNFTAGRIQDDTNPSNSVDIANNFYTEMEWAFEATNTASTGEIYQFRVTRNGTPFSSYSLIPELTISSTTTISISGTADGSNTATVKVAINGTIQAQTSTISSGTWSITGVGEPSTGDVVTVWIDSVSDSAEAIAVTKYAGANITGMVLNALTLSLGSDDNQTLSNDNISQYDNSVSSNEDIFYDVDGNADLTVCSASGSTGCILSVLSGNTYQPDSGNSGNVTAENFTNAGTLTANGNTIYVSGSFTSSGTFNAGTSTVNFNGTGSQTIPALDYYNLTLSNARTTNNMTLASSGIIGISHDFLPMATFTTGTYVITGSTVDFNGSGSQTIPGFNYNNLTSSSSGARTLASTPNDWYNANWVYRRKITFGNNFSGAGTITNFPVMVALDSSRIDYSNTQNSGQDIRFTDSDGTTLLPYEIEKWDEAGTSITWVKVPQIDNSATDYIYIYYGNPAASDAQTKTTVWNNGQVDVWHFGEGTGLTASDSTSTGNTGTLTNGPTWTTGIDGNGISFDGTDDRIAITSFSAGTVNSFSTWIYWNDSGDGVVFGNTGSSPDGYILYADGTNLYYSSGGANYVTVAHGGLSGGWHQISISRNGTSVSFYKDGAQVGTTQTLGSNDAVTSFSIGSYSNGTFPTQAVLDEVRVYNRALSASEIGADWRSTADTFNTYSTQEFLTGSIGIAGTFTPGTNSYTITDSTIDFNGSSSQTIPAFNYNNLVSSSSGARILANSGIIGIATTFTPGPNSYTITGSTVNFNGASTQTVNADFTYNHLQVEPSANSITTNFATGTVTVNGDLTIGNGTNTSVVVNANNVSTTLTVAGSVSISTNTTLQANTSNALTIGDDFTNNGTFTHNNGTVVFNDNTKTSSLNYSADTTFYNLSITTAGKTVEFDEAQKTTVTHDFTVTGTDCTTGRVFLKSVSNGNQWDMTTTGATVSISYADVRDGNAATTAITTSNSTADNDNNTNWTINNGICSSNSNPDSPASLTQKDSGDANITESAWTTTNTPKLGFTITDPDSDTVKYEVQVATDSGFSSLVLDYTHGSFSASGTTFTFVVGTYGSGSCSGTCPSTLSDSSSGYWWRVKAIDDNSAESAYVEFGVAGTMDIKIDATAPTSGTVYDGTSGDQDWNDGSLTELSGNWTGFDANVSGVQKYEYALRRQSDSYYWSVCSGAGVWQVGEMWCDNSTSTTFTQSNLNLATGVTYYVSVKTTDNAGNIETAVDSNGQQVLPLLSFSLSGNTVAFNNLNATNSYTDTKTIVTTTSTNAANGYTIKVYNTDNLRSTGVPTATIPDFSGTWSTPATWSGGQYGFGYTSNDTSVQGSNRFSSGTAFAAFSQTPPGDVVADHTTAIDGSTGSVSSEQFTITYKVAASTDQDALYYQTSSIFIVTANY